MTRFIGFVFSVFSVADPARTCLMNRKGRLSSASERSERAT